MYKPAQKALIISTFPPKHCGIATYAQEQFKKLKNSGYSVYTLGVGNGSSANFNQPVHSIKGVIKAAIFSLTGGYDRVEMHFTNGMIWERGHMPKIKKFLLAGLQYLWLIALSLRYLSSFNLLGHEIETKNKTGLERLAEGFVFMMVRKISVHTAAEKEAIRKTFSPFVSAKKIEIIDHKENMTPKFFGNKFEARSLLGLDQNAPFVLCIGFLQRHKGFDEAVEAIKAISGVSLHVVGSMRVKADDIIEYRNELKNLIEKTPHATLHEDFIDDFHFDAWIQAADAVVLPYHEIWSSGVGARAQILGTPLIIKSLDNLKSQFQDEKGVSTYKSINELTKIFAELKPKITTNFSDALENCVSTKTELAQKVFQDKKILFVMPTFGKEVKGGAEQFVFDLAMNLAARGANLEVWATDSSQVIKRNHAMRNATSDSELPFKVRRFRANVWSERIFDFVHRYMNQEQRCGWLFRKIWKYTNLHGFGMAESLKDEIDRFDVIHLFHYLLGSSHRLSGIAPEKMILHPFIHDEPPLRNPIMRDLFAGVRGVTINTPQSYDLTLNARCGLIPSSYQVIGNGVEHTTLMASTNVALIEKIKSEGYILFVGRMIPEKNLELLFTWHKAYLAKNPSGAHLVCLGSGPLEKHPVFSENDKFHAIGFCGEKEKRAYMQNALGLVNLSLLESFSIVIMEAWLEETPIIVHRHCRATAYHHHHSGSAGYAPLEEVDYINAVSELKDNPQRRQELGRFGRQYVEENYSWDKVCNNYALALSRILDLKGVPRKNIKDLCGSKETLTPNWLSSTNREILGKSFYVNYEETARDSQNISEPWQFYSEKVLKGAPSGISVVDIGAGRGDLLHYLKSKEPQVEVYGIEPDEQSYYLMAKSGINGARLYADSFGDQVEQSSIDVIFMTHVVEHIPWEELIVTLYKLRKTLKPGGKLVLEFPNMLSAFTGTTYFWSDPTHIKPVPVVSLGMALKKMGFTQVSEHQFSPHLSPEENKVMKEKVGSDKLVNDFYGQQDFVFVATL